MMRSAQISARATGVRKAHWVTSDDWRARAGNPAPQGAVATGLSVVSDHPLADARTAAELARRESDIAGAFETLKTVLRGLAPQQFEAGFPARAQATLASMGIDLCEESFAASYTRPLDMGMLHARCALRLFARLVEQSSDRDRFQTSDGEPVEDLIRNWGFHAIDITTCADGREAGLLGHVLRIPLSVVTHRSSYAGAMFPVAQSLQNWETVELSRHRDAIPNAADAPTRYLKIGVYHFSSVSPAHEGCAAHGSDDVAAFDKLHERLQQFRAAVEARHGSGDAVALLMIGHDTDTDSIRVHIPDAKGAIDPERYLCGSELRRATSGLDRNAAKEAVRAAVARKMGVAPDDSSTEGMRWFCGYILKNNIAQVDAVKARFASGYDEAGHGERMILVGDAIDDVQLRNLAFQAQMGSIEEGFSDLAIGARILGKLLAPEGLAIPVLVVRDFAPDIPGDREAAEASALRMQTAIAERFQALPDSPAIAIETAIRPEGGGALAFLDAPACACNAAGRTSTSGGTGA